MVDKEITSEMIIKALEICSNEAVHSCEGCHLCDISSNCIPKLMKQASELIKIKDSEIDIILRKKHALRNEIERLKAEANMADGYAEALEQRVKTEAYKEFAERLCEDRVSNDPVVIAVKTELKFMED